MNKIKFIGSNIDSPNKLLKYFRTLPSGEVVLKEF